jgi:fructose 1,6-bisphosphatase
MGIGFAEKAYSQEEIERFGYASMGGNDKAASGAFNFGLYWALRLTVLLKEIHAGRQHPDDSEVLAAIEREVKERMPDLPAHLLPVVAQRLFDTVNELTSDDGRALGEWVEHGLAVETWHVIPGSRAFVEVESEDPQLLALLSAQNEHNVKRIWRKQRKGWITQIDPTGENGLTENEVAEIERQVEQELRDNRTVFEERKQHLKDEAALYAATRRERTPKGRALNTFNPWERMLYDQEIDDVLAALRPKFIEVYKVRMFLGDDYLAAVSTEKLAAITMGAYVGKDDSVKVGIEPFFALYRGIAKRFVRFNVGNARGSAWPAMRPEASPVAGGISEEAVAVQWSNSIEIAYRYQMNPDGTIVEDSRTGLARREDMYGSADFDPIRATVANVNLIWIQTQGGFTPHGPNVMRDIEAAYPARQTLESLIRPGSPFAYPVHDTTLTTIEEGKWGPTILEGADHVVTPHLSGEAADPTQQRVVLLHGSVLEGAGGPLALESAVAQLRAVAGEGHSIRPVLAFEEAATTEDAEQVAQALGLASGQEFLVLPAAGDPDKLLGLIEVEIPNGTIRSVLGPAAWVRGIVANSPNPDTVVPHVVDLTLSEGKIIPVAPVIFAAFESVATGRQHSPRLAAQLRELDGMVIAAPIDIEASVQAQVLEHQQRVEATVAAAIKG